MQTSATYRLMIRLTALLLLMGTVLPVGVHAVQVVDYCLMSSAAESISMSTDCKNCLNEHEVPVADDVNSKHCEWEIKCSCHIDQAPLNEQKSTIPISTSIGTLSFPINFIPESHGENFHRALTHSEFYSTPPIFLLNSVFLN